MNTRVAVALSGLAIGAVVGANGCAESKPSVQVQMICSPTDTCAFEATCGQQSLGFVTIDPATSAADNLSLYLQVANLQPNNGDIASGRVNTNDAHVDEIAMEYVGVALPSTTTGTPNYIIPASGTSIVKAEVIPDALQAGQTLAALAGTLEPHEIVVKVRMRGYFDDRTRFETDEFPITVRVCSGCAPAVCGTAGTCPPNSEGQRPLTCIVQ